MTLILTGINLGLNKTTTTPKIGISRIIVETIFYKYEQKFVLIKMNVSVGNSNSLIVQVPALKHPATELQGAGFSVLS